MHAMKLCVQALWTVLPGVITMLGCHCRKGDHNASNARGVTAGKMGRNSSSYQQSYNRPLSITETHACPLIDIVF